MRDEWSLGPVVPIPLLCFSSLLQPLPCLLSPQDVSLASHAEGHSVGSTRGTPCAAAITHTGRAARAQQAVLQGGKPPTLLIEGLQQAFITSAACREREKKPLASDWERPGRGARGLVTVDAQLRLQLWGWRPQSTALLFVALPRGGLLSPFESCPWFLFPFCLPLKSQSAGLYFFSKTFSTPPHLRLSNPSLLHQ